MSKKNTNNNPSVAAIKSQVPSAPDPKQARGPSAFRVLFFGLLTVALTAGGAFYAAVTFVDQIPPELQPHVHLAHAKFNEYSQVAYEQSLVACEVAEQKAGEARVWLETVLLPQLSELAQQAQLKFEELKPQIQSAISETQKAVLEAVPAEWKACGDDVYKRAHDHIMAAVHGSELETLLAAYGLSCCHACTIVSLALALPLIVLITIFLGTMRSRRVQFHKFLLSLELNLATAASAVTLTVLYTHHSIVDVSALFSDPAHHTVLIGSLVTLATLTFVNFALLFRRVTLSQSYRFLSTAASTVLLYSLVFGSPLPLGQTVDVTLSLWMLGSATLTNELLTLLDQSTVDANKKSKPTETLPAVLNQSTDAKTKAKK